MTMKNSAGARLSFVACTLAWGAFGCGGDDSTIPNVPDDGGGTDTSMNADTSGNGDTGMGNDTSMGNDTGMGTDTSTGDGGNFNVANVPGLSIWLKADVANSITKNNQNQVSAWADQTSNANNAAQANVVRQPVYNANVINNLPALHFNKDAVQQTTGMMMVVPDSASLRWGTGDFYVVVVARFDNNPGDLTTRGTGVLYSKAIMAGNPLVTGSGPSLIGNIPFAINTTLGGNNTAQGLVFSCNTAAATDIASSTNQYNDNNPRSYAMVRTGTTLDLRVNGVSVGTKTQTMANNMDNTGTAVRIGANGDANTNRLNGDIAEVIGVGGAITAPNLAGVEAYLKAKYNL